MPMLTNSLFGGKASFSKSNVMLARDQPDCESQRHRTACGGHDRGRFPLKRLIPKPTAVRSAGRRVGSKRWRGRQRGSRQGFRSPWRDGGCVRTTRRSARHLLDDLDAQVGKATEEASALVPTCASGTTGCRGRFWPRGPSRSFATAYPFPDIPRHVLA
jgi:hypothetical protein